ncbi:MAG: hypothetical protein JSV53_11310 [candidate division WOR-3 bacterium]|nr:MAG: hypothetical protein JSV53_11310 [candidate division WOR-3 bacterium]
MGRSIFLWIFLSASLVFARTRIIVIIDADVEFDLYQVIYPPAIFPAYYRPTQASGFNPGGIQLTVGYQRVGNQHDISDVYVSTRGSGDFSSSITLDQLYFAPSGEPLPPAGIDPPGGNWRAFSILHQDIEHLEVSGPGLKRFQRPQDFIFKAESDDESGDQSITLYYRVYGL